MIEDFLVPLVVVGLAELGDKTQLCILLLSTKTDRRLQLLAGVVLAFLIVDGAAILAAAELAPFIPEAALKTASGLLFIFFGVLILREKEEEEYDTKPLKNPFISGFSLIFISELGDKTQLASAGFATNYDKVMVFAGVAVAMTLLSAAAIYFGRTVAEKIDRNKLSKVAGAVFILIGLSFFLI